VESARPVRRRPGIGAHLAVSDRDQPVPVRAGGAGPAAATIRASCAEPGSGASLTPKFDIPWLQPFPDARLDTAIRADMRLALVAAMQLLPPRQRAVLVLREVLEFSAAEVAAQLGTTVPAVNSALQRARVALAGTGDVGEISEPDDPEVRSVIERYVRAFEAADIPALVQLLAADAVLEMPPVPLWYRGSRDYGLFVRRVFDRRGPGWAMRQLTRKRAACARRVRAGSRWQAPAAHAPGLCCRQRPGHPQRRVRRSAGTRGHLTCPTRSPPASCVSRDESRRFRR
jgi:hypothetical protein